MRFPPEAPGSPSGRIEDSATKMGTSVGLTMKPDAQRPYPDFDYLTSQLWAVGGGLEAPDWDFPQRRLPEWPYRRFGDEDTVKGVRSLARSGHPTVVRPLLRRAPVR